MNDAAPGTEALPPWKISFAEAADRRCKAHMSEPVVAQKTPFVQKIEPAICWWCGCKN